MSAGEDSIAALLMRVCRELAAVVDQAIGERTIRYTLIVAVPGDGADPDDVRVATCGNATARLTRMMMTDQLIKLTVVPELRRGRAEMKGGACLGCGRLVANTAAGAIGVGVGGRCRYAHTACVTVALERARELAPAPAPAPPAGKLVYTRRCPHCGRKVKRGTVQAAQGYVWHAIPGRDPHLLWTPANLSPGADA